jgi:hypothetical protein
MKSWLFFFVVSIGIYPSYESTSTLPMHGPAGQTFVPDSISFTQQIQPILVKNCSPCHFTGGKMYAKLPFDRAETILQPEVKAGLLKRIRDEKENELFRQFIEQKQPVQHR